MDESTITITLMLTNRRKVPNNFFNGESLIGLDGDIESFNERQFVHVDEGRSRRVVTRKLDLVQNLPLRHHHICSMIPMLRIISSLPYLEKGIYNGRSSDNSSLRQSGLGTKPHPIINRRGLVGKVQ